MRVLVLENKTFKIAKLWLDSNYGNLQPMQLNNTLYLYRQSGQVILEVNMECLTIDENLWNFLENMFGYGYDTVKYLVKEWFFEKYNWDIDAKNIFPANPDRWKYSIVTL